MNANPGGANPVYTLSVKGTWCWRPAYRSSEQPLPLRRLESFAVSQNFRTPYVQQFNLNIQRELSKSTILQVGYVGNLGRKLPVLLEINQPLLVNGVAVRPYAVQYPQLGTIDEAESVANSDYNSLQVSLRQRLWKGLSATGNYTWGHSIDDTSAVRNTVPTNSYDLAFQRGSSTFDVRQVFTSFISYDVPQLGARWPRLTKGCQLNSMLTFSTGQPINILAGTNVSGTGENLWTESMLWAIRLPDVPVLTGTTAVQYLIRPPSRSRQPEPLQHRQRRALWAGIWLD